MKLKKILKYLDTCMNIIIIESIDVLDEDILFEGQVSNVPWSLIKFKLDNSEEGTEAIWYDKEKNSLCIYVKEDNESE